VQPVMLRQQVPVCSGVTAEYLYCDTSQCGRWPMRKHLGLDNNGAKHYSMFACICCKTWPGLDKGCVLQQACNSHLIKHPQPLCPCPCIVGRLLLSHMSTCPPAMSIPMLPHWLMSFQILHTLNTHTAYSVSTNMLAYLCVLIVVTFP